MPNSTMFSQHATIDSDNAMTLNERLLAADLLDRFDWAAMHADRARMAKVLTAINISGQEADRIVDMILANPALYGYGGAAAAH
jgi:hypothetical protein